MGIQKIFGFGVEGAVCSQAGCRTHGVVGVRGTRITWHPSHEACRRTRQATCDDEMALEF